MAIESARASSGANARSPISLVANVVAAARNGFGWCEKRISDQSLVADNGSHTSRFDEPLEQNMMTIGPYSRLLARGTIDGRSRSGRFLKAFEAQLVDHVGGEPSAAQLMLIRRLASLALRCALMDEKAGEDGTFSERDGRQYLAWSNALARGLREIGYAAVPPPDLSLADYLAAKASGEATEAAA
jgi:hypothetical protein